ncbi:ImmA/IrrE family metallo-endopeptidase [Clostridium hydrogeniformans]|uniref:ImmA/IrrE family metallo-endopeptidase n=1 Tax=Clostridium hydrogeniformans TaxID=349933 RepID=UPI00048198ED|nr:ImmA/IrrE family metallo-endopeptidase [Clostridium hydrogeniformans]
MHNKIKNIVTALIKKYDTRNPYELADFLDVILIEIPLGSIAGMYKYINRNKVIFINSSLNYNEKIIVLSHELGHAMLHSKDNCYFMKNKTLMLCSKIERQANIFASELLIPDNLFNKYVGLSLEEISKREYIPMELIKLKIDSMLKFF